MTDLRETGWFESLDHHGICHLHVPCAGLGRFRGGGSGGLNPQTSAFRTWGEGRSTCQAAIRLAVGACDDALKVGLRARCHRRVRAQSGFQAAGRQTDRNKTTSEAAPSVPVRYLFEKRVVGLDAHPLDERLDPGGGMIEIEGGPELQWR